MRPFLGLSLALLALLVACTSSSSGGGNRTPDGDPDATPTLEVERPTFRLEFNDRDGAAEWERVEEAAAYHVTGHVTWWSDCSLAATVEPTTVEMDEKLTPDTSDYTLPRPDDQAYTRIKDYSILITALDGADNVIAYQNAGGSEERICPQ
jgi:hypothetical protein